jgi:uncharacterized protein (DUF2236 family)
LTRNAPVGRHLDEALVEEDRAELLAHLVQRMQRARALVRAERAEVVWLEVGLLPRAAREHVGREVRLLNAHLAAVLGALAHRVVEHAPRRHELALAQVRHGFGLGRPRVADLLELLARRVAHFLLDQD